MCCQLKAKSFWAGLVGTPQGDPSQAGSAPLWQVHSVFTRVMNLIRVNFDGSPVFISLVLPEVGGGINRVIIDSTYLGPELFHGLNVTVGDQVEIMGPVWKIGSIELDLTTGTPWYPQDRQKIHLSSDQRIDLENRLRRMMAQVPSLDPWFEATPFGLLQKERINEFLANPGPERAKRIVGLGPGLTPLGDDCIIGHLTALRVLDRPLDDYYDMVFGASSRTTAFSAYILKEAYESQFSISTRNFIDEVFQADEEDNFVALQRILAQGSSSGPGFGWGFFRTLQKYEKEVDYAYLYPST